MIFSLMPTLMACKGMSLGIHLWVYTLLMSCNDHPYGCINFGDMCVCVCMMCNVM